MSTPVRITLAGALLVFAVAAGTSVAGPPHKSGSSITVRLANPEPRGRPASMIAEAFASHVKALSKGAVLVKISYEAGKTSQNIPGGDLEANLVRLVRTGKVEIGIVPTRAFQAQGVSSFQALQAPFLITTDAAMAGATAGSTAMRVQSGLPTIGLTGLGLAPEGLRRAFGFKKALMSPADFGGIKVRSIPSKSTWALLRALGATPVDLNGDDFPKAVENGAVNGAESSLAIAGDGGIPQPSFTAGNIAFFPKVDALVANAAALKKLTAEQVSILRRAAATARAWALATLTERKARNAYCKSGGTIVTAPSSSIRTLRAKAAPVLAAMQRDSLTRSVIAEIGRFATSGAGVAPCSHGSGAPSAEPTAGAVIPPGVYRKTVSEKELLAAGATPNDAKRNAGTVTLTTTENGYQSIHVDSPYPEYTTTCDKRKMYLRNGLVVIELHGRECEGDFAVAWKAVPEGIEFTRVSPPNEPVLELFWHGVVWQKVG